MIDSSGLVQATRRGRQPPVTEPITLADDPDLAHLIDLLDMLRGPEVASLWGGGDYSIGKKFASRLRPILSGQRRAEDVDYLAVYVLKYLGKDNTHMPQEQIAKWLRGVNGLPAAGHAWAEDTTRTAWTWSPDTACRAGVAATVPAPQVSTGSGLRSLRRSGWALVTWFGAHPRVDQPADGRQRVNTHWSGPALIPKGSSMRSRRNPSPGACTIYPLPL